MFSSTIPLIVLGLHAHRFFWWLVRDVRPCGKAPLAFAVPFERLLHVVASQKEGTVG